MGLVFLPLQGHYAILRRVNQKLSLTMHEPNKKISLSASLVTQGTHRFYTLTIPSDVLAQSCFVSTRDNDPKAGFQRLLDRKRAQEIADYIDAGLGTIPTSVILSAQEAADFQYSRTRRAIEFYPRPKAFMIIDGQHRIFGFSLAKAALRVPVVIYNGLSLRDETRLFIDINTKQRPVPNELLLDIKNMAEYESNEEERLRTLFDTFNTDTAGPLHGLLSPIERKKDKISRVTFNGAIKPLLSVLASLNNEEAHQAVSAYFSAVAASMKALGVVDTLTSPVVFKGLAKLFPDAARKVKDRHGSEYSYTNFMDVLQPLFDSTSSSKFKNTGTSVQAFYENLKRNLESGFQL